ncbi:MAG: ABC transporter permease [Candidatus Thorarchaeota archaeon]|jgi:ABC-2 type transport system permease protein
MTLSETVEQPEPVSSSDYLEAFEPKLMDWTAARIFAMKNLRIALRYPANLLMWGFLPILWFSPFILMFHAMAGSGSSVSFTELSGFSDFISFAVIGWFVWMWLDNSIWAIGNNFRWEQFSGTLEPLFLAPVPRISILVGAALSDTIQGSIQACILLTIASFLFGVEYSIVAILPTIIIIIVMIIALYGFSFMLAGIIMVFKDPSVLTQMIAETTFMVSPINYPLQALPQAARYFAFLVPTTIALITIREIAITGVFDLLSFTWTVGLLVVLAFFLWIVGLACFRWAETWTRKRGHMGGF